MNTHTTYSKPESAGFYCVAETSDGKRYSGRWSNNADAANAHRAALLAAFNGAPFYLWQAFYPDAHRAPEWEQMIVVSADGITESEQMKMREVQS